APHVAAGGVPAWRPERLLLEPVALDEPVLAAVPWVPVDAEPWLALPACRPLDVVHVRLYRVVEGDRRVVVRLVVHPLDVVAAVLPPEILDRVPHRLWAFAVEAVRLQVAALPDPVFAERQ